MAMAANKRIGSALLTALLLAGCQGKNEDAPSSPLADLPPSENAPVPDQYEALVSRLLSDFLDEGMPISRNGDEIDERGDSALFSGLAIGVLSCEDGASIFRAVADNITSHDGRIHRHPALDRVDTSRDAMIGTAFGLVMRWRRCPEDREAIAALWSLHRDYVTGLGNGRLYPGAGEDKQINGGLWWLWDRVANFFGITGDAPRVSKDRFETDMIATASGTVAAKQPCYPLHLNMLQMITAYAINSPVSSFSRLSWCQATRGTGVPMIEYWCEREPAQRWLAEYSPESSGYSYRHQRCKWESDERPRIGPALDYLLLRGLATHQIF